MHTVLNFEFVAILNLLVIILWPATSFYGGTNAQPSRGSVLGIIMLILTIIAVILDIIFLVLALA